MYHLRMLPTASDLVEIRARAADGMRGYLKTEEAARTLQAKKVAEALVDARTHFFTRDGSPDLLGRSRDYRTFVSSCLDDAEVPRESRSSLQAAIRYHISPMLRERYPAEVAALGLEPGSTVERARRRKERDARILSLFSGGFEVVDPADMSLIANLSRLALSRIADLPEGTPEEQAARLRDEFKRLRKALDAAQERLS